jgi:hypothetical protein
LSEKHRDILRFLTENGFEPLDEKGLLDGFGPMFAFLAASSLSFFSFFLSSFFAYFSSNLSARHTRILRQRMRDEAWIHFDARTLRCSADMVP